MKRTRRSAPVASDHTRAAKPVDRQSRGTLIFLGLTLLTVVSFSPLCLDSYDFINLDDPLYVTRNPHVQAGLTPPNVRWAFTTFHGDNWMPLTWLSLQLDAQLHGTRPWGYHLTNVLLHTASVLLLFAVLRWMTGYVGRSAIVAGLFAVHPLRVESVAWVAERKDVLGGLFWMLTLAVYTGYARRPGWRRYALLGFTFALGLLTKPMLVTLPCVLLLLDYWPLRRFRQASTTPAIAVSNSTEGPRFPVCRLRHLLREKTPLLALAAVASALTVLAQGKLVMPLEQFPFSVRLANAVVSYVRYLGKMAWPIDLALHYPHPGDTLPPTLVAGAALLLGSITVISIRARSRRPYLLVGWLWYLGTLVPVIGLIQVATQALADRYTYIPLIGIFLLLVWGAVDIASRWQAEGVAAAVAVVLLLMCGLLTWAQTHYWINSRVLWTHTLEVTGDGNTMAHNGLGIALLKDGDLDAAEGEFLAALRGKPDYADAYYHLGLVAVRRLDWREALRCFDAASRYKPQDTRVVKATALALLSAGEPEKAQDYFLRAREIDPDDAVPDYGLGRCLESQGELIEAEAHMQQAIARAPTDAVFHRELGLILRRQGRSAESRSEYEQSLHLDPNWPAVAVKQAWRLSTHPEAGRRYGAEALHLALTACQASSQPNAEMLDALAAAYAETGQFDLAAEKAGEAASVADSAGRPALARDIRQRRALYLSGKAYRVPAETERASPPRR
jgi:tetratricopeptide (TPR) repeat protein